MHTYYWQTSVWIFLTKRGESVQIVNEQWFTEYSAEVWRELDSLLIVIKTHSVKSLTWSFSLELCLTFRWSFHAVSWTQTQLCNCLRRSGGALLTTSINDRGKFRTSSPWKNNFRQRKVKNDPISCSNQSDWKWTRADSGIYFYTPG